MKKLSKIYLKADVLKYILPEEIIRNNIKPAPQNFINTIINDSLFFDEENMADFDNSINSFVGCCSFGTGHFDLVI